MSTPAIVFRPTGWKGYVYSTDGTVPASGCMVSIHASGRLGEIDMSTLIKGFGCSVRFSPADARSVAAELLSAADAIEGARDA